jgi:hypothetical protein
MKDSELRGHVLQFLYENRRQPSLMFGRIQGATAIPDGIDENDWLRACEQLAQHNLITWESGDRDASTDELFYCVVRINAVGTDVIEGERTSPIPVVIDQSQHIQVTGSQGVQIAGHHSTQQQSISDAFEKVISAIDGANVSEGEKQKARSLLRELLESKTVAALLGSAVSYLLKMLPLA